MAVEIGPLLGETTETSVKVWLKGEARRPGDLPRGQAYEGIIRLFDAGKQQVAAERTALKPEDDFTACVKVTGLKPDTAYSITVETTGGGSAAFGAMPVDEDKTLGHFRTAPDEGSPRHRRLRFGTGSCRYFGWQRDTTDLKDSDRIFAAVNQLHEQHPLDFFLMTGDQIYADVMFHRAARSREDFCTAYRRGFSQEHIARLFRSMPTYMMLDDHEIRDDWSRDRLGEEEELFVNAMHAYRCYQDSHNPDHERPLNKVQDADWWYTFKHGAFPFFVADSRTQRIKRPAGNAHRTILGERQLKSLKDWLKANQAAPRLFVVMSVPLFPDTREEAPFDDPKDKWAGFNEERFDILDFIKEKEIRNVTFVGGDVHNSHVAKLTCDDDPGFAVTSVVSSAFFRYSYLKRKHFHVRYELPQPGGRRQGWRYRYVSEGYQHFPNFVVVDVDLSRPEGATASAEIYSINGNRLFGPYRF